MKEKSIFQPLRLGKYRHSLVDYILRFTLKVDHHAHAPALSQNNISHLSRRFSVSSGCIELPLYSNEYFNGKIISAIYLTSLREAGSYKGS